MFTINTNATRNAFIIFVILMSVGFLTEIFNISDAILWPSAAAVLGIWLFFQGFVQFNRKRLIQNVPTSKINSLAMGLAEIQGKAAPLTAPFKSPFAKMDCVFYRCTTQQFVGKTEGHGSWKTISEFSSGTPFYVDDGSGKVMIDPSKAEIRLAMRYLSSSPDEKKSVSLSSGDGDMKYMETFIIPHEPIYILGTVKALKDYHTDYKSKITKTLIKWWNNPEKRKEFDLDKDGEVSKEEYALMRKKAEEFVRQGAVEVQDLSGLSNLIITRGEVDRTFIISNESEKEMISTMGTKTIFYIIGGITLTLLGIAFLCAFLPLSRHCYCR